MKQKMKLFAVVFGVSLAMLGPIRLKGQVSTTVNDISLDVVDSGTGSKCEGQTGTCTTIQSPDGSTMKLKGKKVKTK